MEKRIGFGRRLGAFVIDGIIASGIAFIIANLWGTSFENFVNWSKFPDESMAQIEMIFGGLTDTIIYMSAVGVLISFIYNIIEGFLGYTLGKLILDIQIGNQDGTPTNQSKLMARFAIKNISTLIGLISLVVMVSAIDTLGSVLGFVVLIGCFFAIGEKKLALHDIIAKTAVFRKSELEDGSASEPLFKTPSE